VPTIDTDTLEIEFIEVATAIRDRDVGTQVLRALEERQVDWYVTGLNTSLQCSIDTYLSSPLALCDIGYAHYVCSTALAAPYAPPTSLRGSHHSPYAQSLDCQRLDAVRTTSREIVPT
jgi:hypothetical protein